MAGALSSVRIAPLSTRLREDTGKNDCLCILSVGSRFLYVIPGFDVLAVSLRVMRVQGYDAEGKLRVCDVFVRDDPSLDRIYPAAMEVTDQTCVDVSLQSEVYIVTI